MTKQEIIADCNNAIDALNGLITRVSALADGDDDYLEYVIKKDEARNAVLAMRAIQSRLPTFRTREAKPSDAPTDAA